MGSGSWSSKDWGTYATTSGYAHKSATEIYSRSLDKDLDPKGVKFRESVDSVDNPNSTALIVTLDVTGSMHPVLESVAKKGLNTLMEEVYSRKPVPDPHVMVMAVGDIECDSAPLQVTQFEADLRIAKQMEKIYFEQGGGGNQYESYALAWYFAARHTKIDCFTKRGKKGYLFTIGDEGPTPVLTAANLRQLFGPDEALQGDLSMQDLLTEVSREWEVFHLIVMEGNHARSWPDQVKSQWREVLGQRAIPITDHKKISEVIVSTIQIIEGASHADVAASWDGTTALVVAEATKHLTTTGKTSSGVVTL